MFGKPVSRTLGLGALPEAKAGGLATAAPRDDLIRYGRVSAGPHIRLARGEDASAGDLIMARRNVRPGQPANPGRELTNRDVLQLVSTTAGPDSTRAEVRRLTGHDPETGQPT